ncbi:MAG TPA: TetR/AcrR family transcriptional regulator [Anaerolineae bacterium]|nr:TetR/AcrR family transcriptional regulator [Anaerolineae bacterium]
MNPKPFNKTTEIVDTILHYAGEYFRKYGYKKTTVDDIAASTHISKKTLYALFPSKQDILTEVAWRDTCNILRTFSSTIPQTIYPDELLISFCRYIFTDRIKHGKNGMFWGMHSDDCILRESYFEALKRVIKDIYDRGVKTGFFKPIDPFFATHAVVNILRAALENFYKTTEPVRMFNDALTIVADAVAFKDHMTFDAMG